MALKRTLANSGRRVVVTGMGTVSPLGHDVETTWAAALEGKSGAAPITQFDHSKMDVHFACEVKNFNSETYISKKELRQGFGMGSNPWRLAQPGNWRHWKSTTIGRGMLRLFYADCG